MRVEGGDWLTGGDDKERPARPLITLRMPDEIWIAVLGVLLSQCQFTFILARSRITAPVSPSVCFDFFSSKFVKSMAGPCHLMFLRVFVPTSPFSGCGVLRSARLELGTTKLYGCSSEALKQVKQSFGGKNACGGR
ncbi:uncharacterized protein LOC123505501 [Portunus trituberculatus]|uniref:uncharacterized protein LOC123505501 n=1 Tax=Portunus trituberculatus TaxID=210409 RepID=UPI001E1D03AD|nr:uncharacterized protein LOC123505501 [Portunus trituberculatus]